MNGRQPVEQSSNGNRFRMFIGERRQHILSCLNRDGRVLVADLSESLGISQITIRKDLNELELRGLALRTYGGALAPQGNTLLELSLIEKEQHRPKEKQMIATAAARLVADDQCVLLDSGSTTTMVARSLHGLSGLTIVTNAVNIAQELSDTNFEVILTGGTLRKNSSSLIGPIAEDTLAQIQADILFLAVDGFDTNVGLMTTNVLESRVNRAMVKASRKVVVVCDSTKFERTSMALIVQPSAVHTVVTDNQISESAARNLRSAGIELILV